MDQTHIDSLLERYLTLLDEYTRLRKELSDLQAGVYQCIARANFAGERGMRYGQDHYDERMRAMRTLRIKKGGEEEFAVFKVGDAAALAAEEEEAEDANDRSDDATGNDDANKEEDEAVKAQNDIKSHQPTASDEKKPEEDTETKEKQKRSNNPLHWYGLFVPSALRTAQTKSIQAVEQIIPRLVSVDAEMAHVEIEIRRARKKRAKARAAAAVVTAGKAKDEVVVEG